jgi:thymidylate synthase (FAD)
MHSAKLISITPDAQNLVSYCARVSNPKNQENYDTASKLLRYCIKHKHWSIFEMAHMVVEIKTTRSIETQVLRHRSFSFQSFSQRYAAVQEKPGPIALRRQDLKNRQNSIEDLNEYTVQDFQLKASQLYDMSYRLYEEMLLAGVARECAREVLPLSTPTTLYMSGTIRSFLHYVDLRCAHGTQAEHKKIADSIKEILYQEVPDIASAMWSE